MLSRADRQAKSSSDIQNGPGDIPSGCFFMAGRLCLYWSQSGQNIATLFLHDAKLRYWQNASMPNRQSAKQEYGWIKCDRIKANAAQTHING
jgi:hypothetical protein